MKPRVIPVLRVLGWLSALAAVAGALAFAGRLPAAAPAGYPGALWPLAAAMLAAVTAALLFAFAANLEILHDIRAALREQRRDPPDA